MRPLLSFTIYYIQHQSVAITISFEEHYQVSTNLQDSHARFSLPSAFDRDIVSGFEDVEEGLVDY